MKKIVLTLAAFSILGCEKDIAENDCVEKIKPNVVCTAQYDPVCGCNMKTYGNACEAGAASIRIIYAGECKK